MRSLKEQAALVEMRVEQVRIALEMHADPCLLAKLDYLLAKLRRLQWHMRRRGLISADESVNPASDYLRTTSNSCHTVV